jgi:hypothetical protein
VVCPMDWHCKQCIYGCLALALHNPKSMGEIGTLAQLNHITGSNANANPEGDLNHWEPFIRAVTEGELLAAGIDHWGLKLKPPQNDKKSRHLIASHAAHHK